MRKSVLFTGLMAVGGLSLYYLNRRARAHRDLLPVDNFDVEKYLGKWYEIARLDYFFERNLNNTTAHYSMNRDGSLRVVNRGYNYKKYETTESIGRARFAGSSSEGSLMVSFFGPLYSSYNIVALDSHYKYALVAGKNLDYLWILSRETTIPDKIRTQYLELAEEMGYDTEKLLWVEHDHITAETTDSLVAKALNQLQRLKV
jgi:apolipoprotein D and lipocalin family protein